MRGNGLIERFEEQCKNQLYKFDIVNNASVSKFNQMTLEEYIDVREHICCEKHKKTVIARECLMSLDQGRCTATGCSKMLLDVQ